MSRTYRKYVRVGFGCGDNREFYKARRRSIRTKNSQHLQDLKQYSPEDMDELATFPKFPKKDTWRETTDGYYLITKDNYRGDPWAKKYKRQIKNKHSKKR